MSARVLGQDTEQYILDSADQLAGATDELLDQARRSVRIHAPDLDGPLLDREAPLASLASLTRTRRARVRVLLVDSSTARRDGHRLVDLARRFPSSIELRLLSPEDRIRQDAWVVADDTGLIYRPDYRRLADGHACFHDVSLAPKLARDFDEWWERGQTDPELRRLYI